MSAQRVDAARRAPTHSSQATVNERSVEAAIWETQLRTPEQQSSELLFPAVTGGCRSPSVLNKPFADVATAIGLGKRFTQRGLRRTFNELTRRRRRKRS